MIFRYGLLDMLMLIPLFILSITLHEAAHAYAAFACGDRTAAREGRLTLNPVAHLDPLGALMVVLVGFGWAKPVPVDERNLRHPGWQIPLVAAAGPLANLLLAIISALGLQLGSRFEAAFVIEPLILMASLNLMLMLFNLIPLPPLDGAGIIRALLPYPLQREYDKLLPYGPFILIVLVFVPGISDLFLGLIHYLSNQLMKFLLMLFAFLN